MTFDAKVGFLNRVLVTETNTIWTVGEREILKSTDGGKSWKSSHREDNVDFFAIASPKAGSIVAVGSEGTILFSENSGDSWHSATLDPAARDNWYSAVEFVNETTGYAAGGFGGSSGLVVTRDGGKSWSRIDINLSDGFIQDIALKAGKIFLLGPDGSVASARTQN
ncbi:MAG: hypothetical protein IPN69_03455 [Acidobacteria bacterium]|nr:hypothetical protein [Acidobacteriota bacterium]